MAQLQQSHLMNFTAQPMGRTISGNAVQSNSIVAITNAGRTLGGSDPADDYQPKGAFVPNESYLQAAADVLASETAAQNEGTSDDYQQYVPAAVQQLMNDNALLPGGYIQYRPGQMMSNGRLATLQTLSAADAAAQPPAPPASS